MSRKIAAEVKNVKLSFKDSLTKKENIVIRNTGFKLYKGEILGIIGESGSGKSVITSLLNGVIGDNARIHEGTIKINGEDVTDWKQKQWFKSNIRGRVVGRVFQNPLSALNPALKIKYQLIEALLDFKIYSSEKECIDVVVDILDKMNMPNPVALLDMYPHELSGGMIQRVVITMVIAAKPDIIIFDEPTTALDPIVQSEILHTIKKINKENNTSMIFITHDIGVISAIADRISVMYAGRIIEEGLKNEILFNPHHPYTWGLLSSLPSSENNDELYSIEGILDMSVVEPEQDAFVFRNQYGMQIDLEKRPPRFKISNTHFVESWLYHKDAPKFEKPEFIKKLNNFKPKGE